MLPHYRHAAADHRTRYESSNGEKYSRQREPTRPGERKAEEQDVAGHVGHEHMPEQEVADRVDQSGAAGHRQQHRRQRAMRPVAEPVPGPYGARTTPRPPPEQ